jgi:hypothetical protein
MNTFFTLLISIASATVIVFCMDIITDSFEQKA